MKYSKQAIEDFYEELFNLYRKHKICIHHEDYNGGFILTTYPSSNLNAAKEYDIDWVYNANTTDLIKNEDTPYQIKKFIWKN